MVIRGRIGQAFGRLIRRADDFGQFVMLSPSFPSRLLSAFPEGTPIRRLPLDEAVGHVAAANVERRKSAFPAFSPRSEEHTSELQSLMRISYAVFCLTKKTEH